MSRGRAVKRSGEANVNALCARGRANLERNFHGTEPIHTSTHIHTQHTHAFADVARHTLESVRWLTDTQIPSLHVLCSPPSEDANTIERVAKATRHTRQWECIIEIQLCERCECMQCVCVRAVHMPHGTVVCRLFMWYARYFNRV